MAQEFTVSLSDKLWEDVQTNLSTDIDPSLTGDISVERMTIHLNETIEHLFTNRVNRKKLQALKAELDSG